MSMSMSEVLGREFWRCDIDNIGGTRLTGWVIITDYADTEHPVLYLFPDDLPIREIRKENAAYVSDDAFEVGRWMVEHERRPRFVANPFIDKDKTYYDDEDLPYPELLEKAESNKSTAEDRINLFNWFEKNGGMYWNGECYQIDKDLALYPVCEPVGEPDEDGDYMDWKVVDAEIR